MKTILTLTMVFALGACGLPESDDGSFQTGEITAVQQGLTCDQWSTQIPGYCLHYAPDPPPGFFSCGGDTNAYPGEFLIFSEWNFGGYCFYAPVPAGGSFAAPYLNDMDRPGPNDAYRVKSYKSNLSRYGALYDGSSYNGAWYTTYPVENKPYFNVFDPSSIIVSN